MLQLNNLTNRAAVANQGWAMEADTISNGRNPKSQTSRRNNEIKVLMKKSILRITVACCVSVLFCISCNTSRKYSVNKADEIMGVWKIVFPTSLEKIKTINKDRFTWTYTRNDTIIYSLGGFYTFDGKTYTEYIENGTPNIISHYGNQKSVFNVKFKDNRMYIVGGNKKETYDEVWERVE